MIPTKAQAKALWDTYNLPERKRIHVSLVARVALFLAEQLKIKIINVTINEPLLTAGAFLHDIDKFIPRLPGEHHPDTGVRILREEGMEEVAELVNTHSLHTILDPAISPKTWEEKLLFLADKIVKDDIITVDERFRLWNDEHLSTHEQKILDASYPKVKALEKEIFDKIGIDPSDIQKFMGRE